MKLSYDPQYNIAYLAVREDDGEPVEVSSVPLSDDVVVDLAPDGTLFGIELLNANRQLAAPDGTIRLFNEHTGQSAELPARKAG